jgi:hypothetical protein
MKIFISGRIAGLSRDEAVRNFERGKKMLMQNTFDFVCPIDLVPEGATDEDAMSTLLPLLCKCDGILLLNDSKFSGGSHIEEKLAKYLKKQIFYEDDLTQ